MQTDAEYEELRNRVEQLERKVAELTRPVATPVLPPVLKSAPARPVASGAKQPKRPPISSITWIASIGAVIFLIGAVYGLTVAVQRGWASPPVRVGAGLLVGVLFGLAAAKRLAAAKFGSGVALLAAGAGTWTFALHFGAQRAELFPVWQGFAGTATGVVLAGLLAARTRCDGALAVALITGLIAPLAFSTGAGNLAGLQTHLLALGLAQLSVHYLTRSGGDWIWSRVIGSAGIWLLASVGATNGALNLGVAWLLELYCALAVVGLGLAWLPRHPDRPVGAGALTAVTLVFAAVCAWVLWNRAHLPVKSFALVLSGLAGVSLALLAPARRRMGDAQHDVTLLVLGSGFALLAASVALDGRWVGVAWSVLALGLSVAARSAQAARKPECGGLTLVAVITTTAASAWILYQSNQQGGSDWPVLNRVFGSGVIATGSWAVLTLMPGDHRRVTFPMMQLVAVNLVAWELQRTVPTLRSENVTLALGGLLATLTYAVAGAGQWLRGVLQGENQVHAGALRRMGYAWLAVAAGKLLLIDLARTELMFRAVVALAVGSILLGAAFWADKRRQGRMPVPPRLP